MKASFLPERDPLCLLQEKWSSCRQTHAQQLIGVRVTPGKWDALVENKKVIEAENGMVVLSAQAEGSLYQIG